MSEDCVCGCVYLSVYECMYLGVCMSVCFHPLSLLTENFQDWQLPNESEQT